MAPKLTHIQSLSVRVSDSLIQTYECTFDERRRRMWNVRNASRFSMAPTALVENGDVTDENYRVECDQYIRGADGHLIPEAELIEPHVPNANVWIIGRGQGHDCGFVPHVLKKDMIVHIADHSKVVLPEAFEYLRRLAPLPHGVAPEECVHLADIRYVLANLVDYRTCWVHCGRIIHHNSWRTQRTIWRNIGEFLAGRHDSFMIPPENRRFTIINPDTRDNQKWMRDHAKARESRMYYRSVNAFNVDEHAVPAISEAARRPVEIVRQSKEFEFFGERMRASTIMLAR